MHFIDEGHTWTVDGRPPLDIETVALHELGHCLGLDHQGGVRDVVMYPWYTDVKREPHADDLEGLRKLYP